MCKNLIIDKLKKDIDKIFETEKNFRKFNNKENAINFENRINEMANKTIGNNITFKVNEIDKNTINVLPFYKNKKILVNKPMELYKIIYLSIINDTNDLTKKE